MDNEFLFSVAGTTKERYNHGTDATVGARFKIIDLRPGKGNKAICHNDNHGPCFGKGDLCIKYELEHAQTTGHSDPPPPEIRWKSLYANNLQW